MKIPCPCCGGEVDAESRKGRGIVLNTRLSLQAECVKLELQIKRTNARIEPDVHADLVRRLEATRNAIDRLTEE